MDVNTAGLGTQSGGVSGGVPFPVGSAFAGIEQHDFIVVENFGVGAASLDFTFEYTATISADATTVYDSGGAAFNFHITGATDEAGETLLVDSGSGFVSVPDFEVADFVESLSGAGLATKTVSGSVKVKYVVAAAGLGGDGEYAFSIFTRANGAAISVPEPGSILIWSLLGIGATCVSYRSRRRRN